MEISLTAVSDKGSALDPPPFFARKRWTKKPVIIIVWKTKKELICGVQASSFCFAVFIVFAHKAFTAEAL